MGIIVGCEEEQMSKILALDPSGTGTTGMFLRNLTPDEPYVFSEFKSSNWKEHVDFIKEIVEKWKPDLLLYENTNYLHQRQHSGTVNLLKLIGAIESLPVKTESILVNQVKDLKSKVFKNQSQISGLEFKYGQGWFCKGRKISLHCLDAFLVYYLWKERNG